MSDAEAAREVYEDAGPWAESAARPRRACANVEACGNTAPRGRLLCHACAKRRQRHSRRRMPRFRTPWERLVAAATRFAAAEGADEYTQAEAVLRGAALRYARCYAPGKRRTARGETRQLPLFETCPPEG